MKNKIALALCIFAIGGYIGNRITLKGYECTPVEKEVIKTTYLASKPKIEYLNKYVIIPTIEKDTLVRPKDYAFVINDTLTQNGVKLIANGKGWGNIDFVNYTLTHTEKEKTIVKPFKGNFLGSQYIMSSEGNQRYYGITFDRVAGNWMLGASLNVNNDLSNFLVTAKLAYNF